MIAIIEKQSEWIKENRVFNTGAPYTVRRSGRAHNPENGMCYLIEDNNGKPIIFYEREVTIVNE